jgi:peptidoglycan/LPS O-acetylase OafA/YrhL
LNTNQLSEELSGHRIIALDGVRGLAVLAVLVFHTMPVVDHQSLLATIWNSAAKSCWIGVDLFFVLSGFLITRILCESKGGPNYFRRFYAGRALRIAPLYFFSVICAVYLMPRWIHSPDLRPYFQKSFENQIWVFTFLQNFLQARSPHQLPGLGHFWTLAIEEQFYVVWPLVVYWLSRRKLLVLSAAICVLEPIARFFCLHIGWSDWSVRQLTYLRLDAIVIGAVLYLVGTEVKTYGIRFAPAVSGWVVALSAASLVSLSYIFIRYDHLPYQSQSTASFGYSAIAILAAALLHAALNNHGYPAEFFRSPVLRWFGKYSYGIYVFSVPAILCFNVVVGGLISDPYLLPLCRFLCCGLVSAGIALISWHLLESPFLRLKSRVGSRAISAALVPVSY